MTVLEFVWWIYSGNGGRGPGLHCAARERRHLLYTLFTSGYVYHLVPTTFKSIYHPGDTAWGVVYTRFLASPLGVCTVPLMIGATASALLDQPIWAYLVWGLPAAIALATAWTHFSLSRTTAEIRFRSGQAAIRSVHDVLLERPLQWKPMFNVRTTSWQVELSVGRTTHELQADTWPNHDALQKAARQSFQSEVSSSASSSHA